MKEFDLPYTSFIGGWFIKNKICDELIKYFKEHRNYHTTGKISDGNLNSDIDNSYKQSTDLSIDHRIDYGPLKIYHSELQNVLEQYLKKYPEVNWLSRFEIRENLNIQYYKKNQGFKKWHFENCNPPTMNRVLVFMTYLNDVPDGGTEFKQQNLITPAKKGLTLIWPAYFTHTHKGQISTKNEKYIITGYYNLLKTEY